jgi:hypothetical protein
MQPQPQSTSDALPPLSFLSTARIAPRSLESIALLPPLEYLPVDIVMMGVKQWMKTRRSAGELNQPLHRDALDDALADVQLELEEQLTDGARLDIRAYKKRRHVEARDKSAEYNSRMEGERRCELLQVLLTAVADPMKRSSGV